jgi:hypothetical protein
MNDLHEFTVHHGKRGAQGIRNAGKILKLSETI